MRRDLLTADKVWYYPVDLLGNLMIPKYNSIVRFNWPNHPTTYLTLNLN